MIAVMRVDLIYYYVGLIYLLFKISVQGNFLKLFCEFFFKHFYLYNRFGSAFTMQICRETSYKDLQKLLLKEMAVMLHDDILTTEQNIPLFGIRLADASDIPQYLDPTVELPLFTDPIDQALAMSGDQPHVKLILEWSFHAKEL